MILSAMGIFFSKLMRAAEMARVESKSITLPCCIWAMAVRAMSSLVSSRSFLNTSYKVIEGTSSSLVCSIGLEKRSALSESEKYSIQPDESTIFKIGRLPCLCHC